MRKSRLVHFGALALAFALVACDGDDGAGVRVLDGGSGSASASGSGSASGVGSGSHSHHASGSVIEGVCPPTDDPTGEATVVDVRLDEWSVVPDLSEVPAGPVTFSVTNAGVEPHELVIVRAESLDELTITDDGRVDEDSLEPGVFVGEIEAFSSGLTCEGSFTLDPGNYLLICNISEHEDGEIESHLLLGMVSSFTVTG